MNIYNTFKNIGDSSPSEFVPFLILYLMLMSLMKFFPGKPWIIFIALVGMIYGYITVNFINEIKPLILRDKYPTMVKPKLFDFGWMENKNNIPMSHILIGSAEVAFVAVLETLISARIADNMTGTRFN
jgi:MFS superfamily sulfate permease-like transporter